MRTVVSTKFIQVYVTTAKRYCVLRQVQVGEVVIGKHFFEVGYQRVLLPTLSSVQFSSFLLGFGFDTVHG